MKSGSLFTGTAALDMAAAEVLGCKPAWFCDTDPGASKLLAYHLEQVRNLGDITAVDWTAVEPVEVLTGGFPCQDISNAGKREGITGARSGLWSYYADAIRVLRPRYVLIENVSALVVRGLDRVLADLAALGFDAEWTTVRASDVGACHRRERLFIAAQNTNSTAGTERRQSASGQASGRGPRPDACGRGGAPAADAGGDQVGQQPVPESGRDRAPIARLNRATAPYAGRNARPQDDQDVAALAGRGGTLANTSGDRRHEGWPEPARLVGGSDVAERGSSVADSDRGGWQKRHESERHSKDRDPQPGNESHRHQLDWGAYEPAIRRWETVVGRPAPAPTVAGTRGGRVLNPALPEWMMGLPDGWITSVPGLSRNDQLKLAGNGVVPQQAIAAFGYLLPLLTREVAT